MATIRNLKSSSSSSFTYQWAYDVFLSFRGEDTRMGFTGHLYNALCEKGIKTFIDDEELRKGEEITPALMMAIQQSRIAIVVFSENYASSTFCLEELTKIMECIKQKGRLIWPIFYKVEPSDVRHLKRSYGKALANCDKEKVNEWRLALKTAANLSGWHFKNGYEHQFIGKIIREVSEKINRIPLHVAKYPVGLEPRVQKVNSLLEVESDEGVHMAGIYGMGGLGKTTLARAVYNCIADQFEGICFLADIRENSMKHGLVQLQKTILFELVGEKNEKLWNVYQGIPIIKSRLCGKKILLILDDVDKLEQLEALAGGLDWFGSRSKIIVTTRNKHLLKVFGVESIYKVEGLNHEDALELFSWNAFKTKEVSSGYEDISKSVILHCGGLPLAVEMIGSDLYGKTTLEWKSALDTYERIPHEHIQEILRVSYDGLKEFEKEIFLDIACFFNQYKLVDVINILDSGRGFAPDYAIQVLIDKSLIQIDEYRVRMHDMIKDMGREIVWLESASKPGERSRLWFYKDILHVLKENKGSDKTEIVMLHMLKDKEVEWDGNALKKMENLKILVIENAHFSMGPNHLPKSLRVLKWCNYPTSSLPTNFDPKKLFILDLSLSHFTFENQLIMKFKSLREMKLSNCQSLKQVPDMSGAPNLKKLYLDCCKNLVGVHDSVGFLEKLEDWNLNRCTSLRSLPPGINLPSLQNLSIKNCPSLKSFPEILGKMEKVTYLRLSDTGINELPFSVGHLVGLTKLAIDRCSELLQLPTSIFMLPKLEIVEAYSCKGLAQINKGKSQIISSDVRRNTSSSLLVRIPRDIDFTFSSLSNDFLTVLLPCLHNVTSLSLDYSTITILPSCINACHSLNKLTMSNCTELREVRGLPPQIKILQAINCSSLTSHSKYLLLNQRLLNSGIRYVCFPGLIIPSLFNQFSMKQSLSFWFRNEWPSIALCLVGKRCAKYEFNLIFNDNPYSPAVFHVEYASTIAFDTEHIIMLNLQLKARFGGGIGRLRIENGWNHVEILLQENYHDMRVHVLEQETNMADIQFKNPNIPFQPEKNAGEIKKRYEKRVRKSSDREKWSLRSFLGSHT